MATDVITFAALLLPVGVSWLTIIWIRPAIARARAQHEALLVRDRIVDGIFEGHIDPDNHRATDVLMFCHVLEEHLRDISLTTVFATMLAVQRAGVDLRAESREHAQAVALAAKGLADVAGERLLHEAENDLDGILANYIVRGSSFWWILVPLQRVSRFLDGRSVPAAKELAEAIDQPRPIELAAEIREASRGLHVPAPMWSVRKQELLTPV